MSCVHCAVELHVLLMRQLATCHWQCAEASAIELQRCNFTTPREFDPYLVLRKLYGPWFEANGRGRGQMLILGQHNSGTSMLARLLMLMGAFQGNVKGVVLLHTAVLRSLRSNGPICAMQEACHIACEPHRQPCMFDRPVLLISSCCPRLSATQRAWDVLAGACCFSCATSG